VHGHCGGIAPRQDQGRALAGLGTDGAEDVGRGGALIARRSGPRAALGPAAGEVVLLADPGLIAEPDLYVGRIDALVARDLVQNGGKTFLKCSIAPSACA
jgi:hypothetical protein